VIRPALILAAALASLTAACATFTPSVPGEGQHAYSFQKRVTQTVGARFLVYMPKDFRSQKDKRWPLIIFLHGSGERGDDVSRVAVNGPPKLASQGRDFPFIIVSPQAPENGAWSTDVLNALLDEVLARLPVDTERVYLTGLSMGGYGTWSWALDAPGRFAAIAPVSGIGDSDRACLLKNMPIWAFHGGKDPYVPLTSEEEMIKSVNDCGGSAKFTVYPDAGHDVWTRTYDDPALYSWFLEHRRGKPARTGE
jgi:predicted peptidase